MLTFLRPALSLLSRSREWLVFLAVAAAAAWLYVRYETVRVDRDALMAWARESCAGSGEPFAPSLRDARSAFGRPTKVLVARGARCGARIVNLAAFERHASIESARILTDAMTARDARIDGDAALARAAAEGARASNERMEKANAQIEGDRTGPDWFDALNDLAGLRGSGS